MRFIFLFLLISNIHAGAKIPPLGHGELFISTFFYQSSDQFNEERDSGPSVGGGEFDKYELGYFWIHTFLPRWAVLARGSLFSSLSNEGPGFDQSFSGLGDQAVGLRYQYHESRSHVRSIESSVTFPTYSSSEVLAPGNGQLDFEVRHLMDWYQVFYFFDFVSFEQAFVKRLSGPADQIKLDLNIGKRIGSLLFIYHTFFVRGLENESSVDINLNPSRQADFDILSTGPSVTYQFSKKFSLQAGVWKEVWGRNTGKGTNLFLSGWINY